MTEAEPTIARVEREIDAPPERVFDAWLLPERIRGWMMGPAVRDEVVLHLAVDPKVGGRFSFLVRRGATEIDHVGEYLEIDRPRRLRFTWGVADRPQDVSKVSITISDGGERCVLTLEHELAAGWSHFRPQAEASWSKMLDALIALCEAG